MGYSIRLAHNWNKKMEILIEHTEKCLEGYTATYNSYYWGMRL